MRLTPLLLPFLMLLAGCATVTADEVQDISLATEPTGAQCTLSNAQGSWDIAQTPGKATVHRDASDLVIRCTLGNQSATQTLEAFTRGRAYGNLLLVGVPALVDAYSGAGYEYRPTTTPLTLK